MFTWLNWQSWRWKLNVNTRRHWLRWSSKSWVWQRCDRHPRNHDKVELDEFQGCDTGAVSQGIPFFDMLPWSYSNVFWSLSLGSSAPTQWAAQYQSSLAAWATQNSRDPWHPPQGSRLRHSVHNKHKGRRPWALLQSVLINEMPAQIWLSRFATKI